MTPPCFSILSMLRAYMKLYLTLCETFNSLLRHRRIRFLLLSPDLLSRADPYPTTGGDPPKWRINSLKDKEEGPCLHTIIREETSIIWVIVKKKVNSWFRLFLRELWLWRRCWEKEPVFGLPETQSQSETQLVHGCSCIVWCTWASG